MQVLILKFGSSRPISPSPNLHLWCFFLFILKTWSSSTFQPLHPTIFPQTMFKHILKDYPGFEESRILMLFWKQIQVLKRNQIVFWQSQHGCNGGRSGVGIYGGNLSWIFTSNGPTLPCLKYTVFSFLMSSFLAHFITQQLKDSYPLGVVVRFDPSIIWRHVGVACFQSIRSRVFYTWLNLQKQDQPAISPPSRAHENVNAFGLPVALN